MPTDLPPNLNVVETKLNSNLDIDFALMARVFFVIGILVFLILSGLCANGSFCSLGYSTKDVMSQNTGFDLQVTYPSYICDSSTNKDIDILVNLTSKVSNRLRVQIETKCQREFVFCSPSRLSKDLFTDLQEKMIFNVKSFSSPTVDVTIQATTNRLSSVANINIPVSFTNNMCAIMNLFLFVITSVMGIIGFWEKIKQIVKANTLAKL